MPPGPASYTPIEPGWTVWRIVLAVLAALTVATALLVGRVYWYMHSPEPPSLFGPKNVMGRHAPGTEEVRAQAGCFHASIITTEELNPFLGVNGDAALPLVPGEVDCTPSVLWPTPTCDRVAAVYASSAHPIGTFQVTVGTNGSICEQLYSKDAARLDAGP